MFRRIAVLGVLLLAACGNESGTTGNSQGGNAPNFPVGATVRSGELQTSSVQRKVVLKARQQTTTYNTIYQDYDSEGNPSNPFACTVNADCAGKPGASADVICSGGYCANPVVNPPSDRVFFAQNVFDQSGASFSFNVPCDTTATFVAEVYGATGAHTDGAKNETFALQEIHVSDPFVVTAACAAVDKASSGAVKWDTAVSNPWPVPSIGTIYAGLPHPYDEYSVTFTNLRSASWAPTFTIKNVTDNVTFTTSGAAQFAAPTTATDTTVRAFTAAFKLDSGALTAEDLTNLRTWTVTLPGGTLFPSIPAQVSFTKTPIQGVNVGAP